MTRIALFCINISDLIMFWSAQYHNTIGHTWMNQLKVQGPQVSDSSTCLTCVLQNNALDTHRARLTIFCSHYQFYQV